MEDAAATVLQAVYRSLSARYFAKQKRLWRVEARAVAAAVTFQACWRGRIGRRRAAEQREIFGRESIGVGVGGGVGARQKKEH